MRLRPPIDTGNYVGKIRCPSLISSLNLITEIDLAMRKMLLRGANVSQRLHVNTIPSRNVNLIYQHVRGPSPAQKDKPIRRGRAAFAPVKVQRRKTQVDFL